MRKQSKVFVSGCFDMLHSGHVEFFRQASKYGKLYVSIGSDKNVLLLKNRSTINTEKERLFMVSSIKYVHKAFIAAGTGKLDFTYELEKIKPDIFIVNEDGHSEEKKELCKKMGVKYIVLQRKPHKKLPARSTTDLRKLINK